MHATIAGSYLAARHAGTERDSATAAAYYLNVLKAGGSNYPVEILKKAGLDMTTPAPYQALVAKFSRTLDQVEALL